MGLILAILFVIGCIACAIGGFNIYNRYKGRDTIYVAWFAVAFIFLIAAVISFIAAS